MRSTATSRGRRGGRDSSSISSYRATTLSPPKRVPANSVTAVLPSSLVSAPSVSRASAADHALVQHLLAQCGIRLSAGEFQAQLDDPCYLPGQRLLARHHGTLVGHGRLLERRWHFGEVALPVSELSDLAVLPEQQACGAEVSLLEAAESLARQSGAAILVTRSSSTRLLQQHGWIAGPRHTYSMIGARELSSAVRAVAPVRASPLDDGLENPFDLTVRLWRRIELDALIRLYNAHCARGYGAPVRDENYWAWLITRGGFDRIYVAIDGPARVPTEQAADRILGYVVLREAKLVECVAPPSRENVLHRLLARACDDALERDWHPLRLEAAPDHPLHALVTSAGGRTFHHDADEGQALMVKVLNEGELVRYLSAELLTRARCARLPLPIELSIATEQGVQRLVLSRRGARLVTTAPGRASVHCCHQDWLRLLLGRSSAAELSELQRLRCSNRNIRQTLQVLLPRLPLWLPSWDVLPAIL